MCLGPLDKWVRVEATHALVAYRAFKMTPRGLFPVTRPRQWPYYEGRVHSDKRCRDDWQAGRRRGFYCLRSWQAVQHQYLRRDSDGVVVCAKVLIWGNVAVHREARRRSRVSNRAGYRAEFMKIVKVYP